MSLLHFFEILTALLAVICCVLYKYVCRLRWRMADQCMMLGQSTFDEDIRRVAFMRALVYGEQRATPFYYFSSLKSFMKEQPLVPFTVKAGDGTSVPVVFYNYYIPSRYLKFASEQQKAFVEIVWMWKDKGKTSCFNKFDECIKALSIKGVPTVIFMPTSKEKSNYSRYGRLAYKMKESGRYNPELNSVTYLHDRDSKHTSHNRSSIDSISNIVVSPAIYGKECVLVDDICTSGASIRDHVEELRRYDVKVIGVVCLGRTVDYTKDSRMIYRTALQESNLTTMEKILNLIC